MPLSGTLDIVTDRDINGWAWDSDAPDQPVSVILTCDGRDLACVPADRYRSDLEHAGIGDGRHSFELRLCSPLSPLVRHVITARHEKDGEHLGKSPTVLEPASAFSSAVQESLVQILSTFADDEDLAHRLVFLTDQADRLRQLFADRQSGAAKLGIAGAVAARIRPRALVIDDRIPLLEHDAGSNAVLSHMRALKRLGYDVVFAPANLRGDGAILTAAGIACCLHPWYASIEEVLKRQRGTFALVYLHRISTAARYITLAREYQPKARVVYSVADLHHLRLERQAAVEHRPDLARTSEIVRRAELVAARQADAVITHSIAEAAVLQRHMDAEKIHVVPWSVAPRPTRVPVTERRGFAFVGGYGHPPNVDAALWLVDRVMPELEARGSAIACSLIGSDMPEALRTLRRHGVDPVGYVPDLAAVFNRVRLTVAPLIYGAGAKGKVLDSLAAGVPCVCTPIAAEGLDLPDILLRQIASTPADLATSIRALHDDQALNQACSEAGLAYINATANEERVDRLLQGAIGVPAVETR